MLDYYVVTCPSAKVANADAMVPFISSGVQSTKPWTERVAGGISCLSSLQVGLQLSQGAPAGRGVGFLLVFQCHSRRPLRGSIPAAPDVG